MSIINTDKSTLQGIALSSILQKLTINELSHLSVEVNEQLKEKRRKFKEEYEKRITSALSLWKTHHNDFRYHTCMGYLMGVHINTFSKHNMYIGHYKPQRNYIEIDYKAHSKGREYIFINKEWTTKKLLKRFNELKNHGFNNRWSITFDMFQQLFYYFKSQYDNVPNQEKETHIFE